MNGFVLSPEAEEDIWSIWRYLALEAGLSVANRVESTIFDKIAFLTKMPSIGHWRRDLTTEPLKFFAVYSYLIVYRPETKPLEVVAILHGRRDVAELLKTHL
jgi:plasmid stabilization system protein ParE